jgi:PAS domain S-box-containing protein
MAVRHSKDLSMLFERTAESILRAVGADEVIVAPDPRGPDGPEVAVRRREGVTPCDLDALLARVSASLEDATEIRLTGCPDEPPRPGTTAVFPLHDLDGPRAAVCLLRHGEEAAFTEAELELARLLVAQSAAGLAVVAARTPRRAFLEGLFANAPEAVAFLDEHHRILEVNREFERMFGYRFEEIEGGVIDEFIAAGEHLDEARMLSSTVENGGTVSLETRRTAKDGHELDVSVLGGPVLDDGVVVGIFAIYRDITARTRTEAALRESEARYRDIFEQAPVGIFQTHADGRPLRINGTMAHMLGYDSVSELFRALDGSAYRLYADPDDRDRFLRLIKQHGAVANYRYEVVRRDGTRLTVSETSRISAWRSETDFVIDGFIIDITALRTAQRQLTAKERRLRGIFNAARDMALVLAEPTAGATNVEDFRIVEFSAGAERMLGYRNRDAMGLPLLTLHPAREHEDVLPKLSRVAEDGEAVNEELALVRRDGKEVPVVFTAHPVFGSDGRVSGIVEVAVDISERKRAEWAIEASLREKEVLLQEIHHRVKNNMQIISSILSLEIGHLDDPAVRQALQVSQSRIRSMSLIHEKLYQSEDLARINIAEYVGDLCRDLKTMGPNASPVDLTLDAAELHAGVDFAIPFGLIVNELVTNAIKHAQEDDQAPKVRVSLSQSSEGTVLVVSDNGPGFPDDFDPAAGTTLGMELVSSLVSQLRGNIEFLSEGGAKLRVVVPPPSAPRPLENI